MNTSTSLSKSSKIFPTSPWSPAEHMNFTKKVEESWFELREPSQWSLIFLTQHRKTAQLEFAHDTSIGQRSHFCLLSPSKSFHKPRRFLLAILALISLSWYIDNGLGCYIYRSCHITVFWTHWTLNIANVWLKIVTCMRYWKFPNFTFTNFQRNLCVYERPHRPQCTRQFLESYGIRRMKWLSEPIINMSG